MHKERLIWTVCMLMTKLSGAFRLIEEFDPLPWDSDSLSAQDIPLDKIEDSFEVDLDGVSVFVGSEGDFEEEFVEDEPLDLGDYDKSLLNIRKRQADGNWNVAVDGWFRDGDDEVFVQPDSWKGDTFAFTKENQLPHVVKKHSGLDMEDDFLYALSSTDSYVRSRRAHDDTGDISVVVDLLIVVDNAVYREAIEQYGSHGNAMKAIKKYYRVLVSLVDTRYSAINDPSLIIRVKLSKIFVASDRVSSPWSEYHVRRSEKNPREFVLDPSTGLKALREWLHVEKARSLSQVNYDHAMAFTGYTMMSKSGKVTTGMAYIGTICQTDSAYSCSILGETGGFVNAGTAVHELAHSLGAKHDGSGDNSHCPISDNYIMAPFNTGNPDVLANYFYFSRCSLDGFRHTIGSEEAACLLDSGPPDVMRGPLPGTTFSPDEQCRDVFGPTSGRCKSPGIQEPEAVCVRLWCIKPTNPEVCITTTSLAALYGTPCAKHKICKHGQCVPNDRLPHKGKNSRFPVSQNDVIKMSSKPGKLCEKDSDRKYCQQLVMTGPQYCDMPDIRKFCCYSCHFTSGKK